MAFNPTDIHFMQHALQLAALAEKSGEVPVGAVIVQDSQIIGRGFNQPIVNHDASAHAEIIAIRDAGKTLQNYRLINTVLYVTIEPCLMCVGAIVHARIKRVVFAARDARAGAVISQIQGFDAAFINHKVEYEEGLLEENARNMIQSFFRRRR